MSDSRPQPRSRKKSPAPQPADTPQNGDRAEIFAGTSGWGYPSWKPRFYPDTVKTKDFLHYYSRKLTSVEVNYTFRRTLSPEVADAWLADTPPEFIFSFKMPQAVTHFRRLKNAGELVTEFTSSLSPFAREGKLGAVLVQLAHNMKQDAGLLNDFLRGLPRHLKYAVEFRHASWLNELSYDVLRKNNAAICVTEGQEELTTPEMVTADFRYYRLRRKRYTKNRISELAAEFRQSAQSPVFCYFKHEENPDGAKFASALLKAMAAASTTVVTSR